MQGRGGAVASSPPPHRKLTQSFEIMESTFQFGGGTHTVDVARGDLSQPLEQNHRLLAFGVSAAIVNDRQGIYMDPRTPILSEMEDAERIAFGEFAWEVYKKTDGAAYATGPHTHDMFMHFLSHLLRHEPGTSLKEILKDHMECAGNLDAAEALSYLHDNPAHVFRAQHELVGAEKAYEEDTGNTFEDAPQGKVMMYAVRQAVVEEASDVGAAIVRMLWAAEACNTFNATLIPSPEEVQEMREEFEKEIRGAVEAMMHAMEGTRHNRGNASGDGAAGPPPSVDES